MTSAVWCYSIWKKKQKKKQKKTFNPNYIYIYSSYFKYNFAF